MLLRQFGEIREQEPSLPSIPIAEKKLVGAFGSFFPGPECQLCTFHGTEFRPSCSMGNEGWNRLTAFLNFGVFHAPKKNSNTTEY